MADDVTAGRPELVVGLVTLPAFVEGLIERAVHGVFGLEHFWGYVLVSAAVGSVVGAYCGLMEVILARELSLRYPRTGDQR